MLRLLLHKIRMRNPRYAKLIRGLAERVEPRPGETIEEAVERAYRQAIADGTLIVHPDDVGKPLGPRTRVRAAR